MQSVGQCALQGLTLWCRQAIAEIDALVDTSIPERDPLDMDSEAASSGNGASLDLEGGLEALGPFFSANEGFRGQIRHDVLKAANSQVWWNTDPSMSLSVPHARGLLTISGMHISTSLKSMSAAGPYWEKVSKPPAATSKALPTIA